MDRSRKQLLVAGAIALLLVGVDLAQPPNRQISARVLLSGIDLYRAHGSAWTRRMGVRCRFEPTCSLYARRVIQRDGALRGSLRAGWRILRCGPWTPAGTRDEP